MDAGSTPATSTIGFITEEVVNPRLPGLMTGFGRHISKLRPWLNLDYGGDWF